MDVREVEVEGWERVLVAREGEYHCVVAIHSTALGNALGGTRLWRYDGEADALGDALRLSRGMTYKNAMAGLAAGGGKSVILMPERLADREALFLAHGRCVEMLGGVYTTGEDVGTSPADMDIVAKETRFVAGTSDGIGDPSPRTARGVFRAMQAAAAYRLGYPELKGVRVALQGCGNVGAALAAQLAEAGARLVVSDVDRGRAKRVAKELDARVAAPDAIYDVKADVFAPCALGGILNAETIPRLRCSIVVGGANNQLREWADGARLAERGIVYVPDYVANAGGVITGFGMLSGHPPEWGILRVDRIFQTVEEILRRADQDGIPPHVAADLIADARIAAAKR
jgi:leucine dehydrogenase